MPEAWLILKTTPSYGRMTTAWLSASRGLLLAITSLFALLHKLLHFSVAAYERRLFLQNQDNGY